MGSAVETAGFQLETGNLDRKMLSAHRVGCCSATGRLGMALGDSMSLLGAQARTGRWGAQATAVISDPAV